MMNDAGFGGKLGPSDTTRRCQVEFKVSSKVVVLIACLRLSSSTANTNINNVNKNNKLNNVSAINKIHTDTGRSHRDRPRVKRAEPEDQLGMNSVLIASCKISKGGAWNQETQANKEQERNSTVRFSTASHTYIYFFEVLFLNFLLWRLTISSQSYNHD